MARVLLTGGAGALGQRLLPQLQQVGWTVRCLVHRRAVAGADEVVAGDLADAVALERAVAGADAVLHLAAITHARSSRGYDEVNVAGTARLVEAARHCRVERFVHVSTRAIAPSGGAYSRSKRRAEDLVRDSRLDHVIVRLPEIYGTSASSPGRSAAGGSNTGGSGLSRSRTGGPRTGRHEGVDVIIDRARRGAPIALIGDGSQQLRPLLVDDAILPLVAASGLDARAGRTYTLAGECVTVRSFTELCIAHFGSRSRIVSVPGSVIAGLSLAARIVPLPIYPDQLARLRSEKPPPSPEAAAELGFRPRSLADGLRTLSGGGR